jgi:hypothetical protein
MKKILYALGVSLFVAGAAQATVVSLNLAASGDNVIGTVVTTSVTDDSGATFDIQYTLGAEAAGTGTAYVGSTGTQMGVGNTSGGTDTTIDGDESNVISFTNLSIVNFVANDSGYVLADFEGLTFTGVVYGNASHTYDGAYISFDNYVTQDQQALNGDAAIYEDAVSLTGLSNYSGTETDLYIMNDNARGTNRFSINGLEVSYTVIPEPATIGMLGLGAVALLAFRRRIKE